MNKRYKKVLIYTGLVLAAGVILGAVIVPKPITIDEIINYTNNITRMPIIMSNLGEFVVTAYCCEKYEHICGTGDGKAYNQYDAIPKITCAADLDVYPLGTNFYIDDIGVVTVTDKGSAIKGNHLDIVFETHEEALKFGKRHLNVWLLEPNQNYI